MEALPKARLRQHYRTLRRQLAEADGQGRSRQVCERFFQDVFSEETAFVHVFLPIRRQQEVDTFLIIDQLQARFPETALYVPVMGPAGHPLTTVRLWPGTVLTENTRGIPEPAGEPAAAFPPAGPGLVLVPLLAFDAHGHRLGYGGGYYDRFLASLPPAVRRVGLSLLPAADEPLPAEPHDVPLHACVTPRHTWCFHTDGPAALPL